MNSTVQVRFYFDAEVNQNEFKNFVKSCPFSNEGGQSLSWGADPDGKPLCTVKIQENRNDVSDQEYFDWLASQSFVGFEKITLLAPSGEVSLAEHAPEKVAGLVGAALAGVGAVVSGALNTISNAFASDGAAINPPEATVATEQDTVAAAAEASTGATAETTATE